MVSTCKNKSMCFYALKCKSYRQQLKWTSLHKAKLFGNVSNFFLRVNISLQTLRCCSFWKLLLAWQSPAASSQLLMALQVILKSWENSIHTLFSFSIRWEVCFKFNRWHPPTPLPNWEVAMRELKCLSVTELAKLWKLYLKCGLFLT